MKSVIGATSRYKDSSRTPSICSGEGIRTARMVARPSGSRVITSGATGAGGPSYEGGKSEPGTCGAAGRGESTRHAAAHAAAMESLTMDPGSAADEVSETGPMLHDLRTAPQGGTGEICI